MTKKINDLIGAAEAALNIEIVSCGRSAAHYAREAGAWYRLTAADLRYATECAEAYQDDAYSHWCAASGREMSPRAARRAGLPV